MDAGEAENVISIRRTVEEHRRFGKNKLRTSAPNDYFHWLYLEGCFLETSCAARWRMNVLNNLCLQREIWDFELCNMSRLHVHSVCTRLFPLSDQESIKQSQLSVHGLTSADSDDDSLRLAWQRKCWIFCVDNHSSDNVLLYPFTHRQLTQSVNVSTLTCVLCRSFLFKGTLLVFVSDVWNHWLWNHSQRS